MRAAPTLRPYTLALPEYPIAKVFLPAMRLFFARTATSAVAVAMLWATDARGDVCTPIRKTIATTYALGPDCVSPVGVCTVGTVPSGRLAGTTRFTALTINPGPSPELLVYTGELVITTPDGTLTLRDFGLLNSTTARYFEMQQIISGTGIYAGARGVLTSQGRSTATGFQGVLSGAVCTVATPTPTPTPMGRGNPVERVSMR